MNKVRLYSQLINSFYSFDALLTAKRCLAGNKIVLCFPVDKDTPLSPCKIDFQNVFNIFTLCKKIKLRVNQYEVAYFPLTMFLFVSRMCYVF